MVTFSLKDSGTFLGTIDDADLQVLVDQLEEEHDRGTDYYIGPATIDILERNGASAGLVKLLRAAVGSQKALRSSGSVADPGRVGLGGLGALRALAGATVQRTAVSRGVGKTRLMLLVA